ncbi:hypothetical protein pEaSNUABM54_00207 [Erwinia phage pEa_SNUABM_54]|nr:hypothetical protein pEaSNUABM54_00207 [Erwinia phage pEa_SNUABM_54]
MTTIVYRDGVLAADCQMLVAGDSANRYYFKGTKIYRPACKTLVYASTGMNYDATTQALLTNALKMGIAELAADGITPRVRKLIYELFTKETIVCTKTKVYHIRKGDMVELSPEIPWLTVGSGTCFSGLALQKGLNAKASVEFANKMDVLSGFGVETVLLNKLRKS